MSNQTIFISHKTEDKQQATAILDYLRQQGYPNDRLFLDSDPDSGIVAGQKWERVLYDRLQDCVCLLVVGTSKWTNSKWCFAEAFIAKNREIPIIALKMEDNADLSMLDQYQAVQGFSTDAEGLKRLVKLLKQNQLEPLKEDVPLSRGWTKGAKELSETQQEKVIAELRRLIQPEPWTRRITLLILALIVFVVVPILIWGVFGDWIQYQITGRVTMTADEFADGADKQGLAAFVKDTLEDGKRIRLTDVELAEDTEGKRYINVLIGDRRYSARCYLSKPSPADLHKGDLISIEAKFSRLKNETSLEFDKGIVLVSE